MADRPRSRYVSCPIGDLHITESGSGPALLLLHQAPRSWDEFREFLPFAAERHRVIAMDMVGFGNSVKVDGPQSIELYARGVRELLCALDVSEVAVLGHHTGALVALEVAAAAGSAETDRSVTHLVLSSCPFTGPERRALPENPNGVDRAVRADDGSHLIELWSGRLPFYPEPAAPLLDRFLHDALAFGVDPAEGHRACDRYRIEDRIGLVRAPTLVMAAGADPFAMPHVPALRDGLCGASEVSTTIVEGGTVALFETRASTVAEVVLPFLDRLSDSSRTDVRCVRESAGTRPTPSPRP